jgi:hypothetical protein
MISRVRLTVFSGTFRTLRQRTIYARRVCSVYFPVVSSSGRGERTVSSDTRSSAA